MKKILLLLVLSLTIILSGCSNTVISNPNGIVLSLTESLLEYMPYEKEQVPSFTFAKKANFNTISNTKFTFQKILSNNDDFLVSEEITKLFTQYEGRIETKIDNERVSSKTRMNRIEEKDDKRKVIRVNLLVDEELLPNQERPLRVVYDEVAFIMLDNGLQLTLEYRRFTAEGITYYAWRYTRSITLYLHFPLMVHINENNQRELLILPLPNYTKYSVGPQLELKKLLETDTYLSSDYYQFNYPEKDNSQEIVKQFYIDNHEGRDIAGDFVCTYLGIDYKIEFLEENFQIFKY